MYKYNESGHSYMNMTAVGGGGGGGGWLRRCSWWRRWSVVVVAVVGGRREYILNKLVVLYGSCTLGFHHLLTFFH